MTDKPAKQQTYTAEEWLAQVDYNEQLKKYKALPDDAKAKSYADIVQKYNQVAVIKNAASADRYKNWLEETGDYPYPNLDYTTPQQPAEQATKAEPPTDLNPPTVKGEQPLADFAKGASNWLHGQKLDLLAAWANGISELARDFMPTDQQANIVDTAREVIGWGVKNREAWAAPDQTIIQKIGTTAWNAVVDPLSGIARRGQMSITKLFMEADLHRVETSDVPRTDIRSTLTGREKYEIYKNVGGTTNVLSSGIVDLAKPLFQSLGGVSYELMGKIFSGDWKGGANLSADFIKNKLPKIWQDGTMGQVFSNADEKSVEAEFVKRIREGDSPQIAAFELSDPIKEMVGDVIFDPLNYTDFLIKPIREAGKLWKARESTDIRYWMQVNDKVADIAVYDKAVDTLRAAEKTGKWTDEATGAVNAISEITRPFMEAAETEMKAAQTGKLIMRIPFSGKKVEVGGIIGRTFSKVSSAHTTDAMNGMHDIAQALMRDEKLLSLTDDASKASRAMDILMGLGRWGCGKGDDITTYNSAMKILAEGGVSSKLFSSGGGKTAQVLANLLFDEAGHLDPSKMARLENIILDAMGKEDPVIWIAKGMEPIVSDVFPTIGRRLEFEAQAVSTLDDMAKGPSKRVLSLQEDIVRLGKEAKKITNKIAGKPGAKLVEKDLQRLAEIEERIGTAQRFVDQASNLPRNLNYWLNNPVSDLEKLGWKVLEGKEKLYNVFMPFLNRIYIRWNPGQWGRNAITNELHKVYDLGITGSSNPVKLLEEAKAWHAEGLLPDEVLKIKSSFTGEEITAYTGPISHEIEELWHVKVADASIQNTIRRTYNTGELTAAKKILTDAGISDDVAQTLMERSVFTHKLNPDKAVAEMLAGDVTQDSFHFITDNKEREMFERFGLKHGADDVLRPNKVLDEKAWDDYLSEVEYSVERGKSTPPALKNLDGPSDEVMDSFMGLDADSKNATNPKLVLDRNYYGAQHEAYEYALKRSELLGSQKLAGNKPPVFDEWRNICLGEGKYTDLGEGAIRRSRESVKKVQNDLWETYHKTSVNERNYAATRVQVNKIMYEGADAQHEIRVATFKAMREHLRTNGADVIEWQEQLAALYASAEDLWGDSLAIRKISLDEYVAGGRTIHFVGGGPGSNKVLDAFASRGIPLHSNPKSIHSNYYTGNGRSYSWVSIQEQLRKKGINWDISKIAKGQLTPDEITALEGAVDAIAVERKIVPKAGIGRDSAFIFSDEWQIVPDDLKGAKPGEWKTPGGVEIKEEGGKTYGRWMDTIDAENRARSTRASIIDQVGPKVAKKKYDRLVELRSAETASEVRTVKTEGTAKGPLAQRLEKVEMAKAQALEDIKVGEEQAKRLDEMREIESYIYRKYERLPVTSVPRDPSMPVSIDQGVAAQENEIMRVVKDLKEKAQADARASAGVARKYTPEQKAAVYNWLDDTKRRMTDIKPAITQVARSDVNFTMLNYSDRRGFDVALGFVFPYHFWYSRTYWNWMKRIAQNPALAANYASYRKMLEQVHYGLPDYWKYSLNTNELFGLDSDNPLYFNLEATFNPLNGITGVDFNDPDRNTGWFANLIQQTAKFGPSVHTPILLGIGLVELLKGNRDAAESWIGRMIPQTGTIKALSNITGINPLKGIIPNQEGGTELDPMVLAMGGSKWERQGIQRVISQFEADGKLPDGTPYTHEQAIDDQYAGKGPVWDMAAQVYNSQRAPGRILSSLGGPGFQTRPKTDIYIDQFYTEINKLFMAKGTMPTEKWQNAMSDIYKKYPYATGLLMARRSGVARDEALAYDVLSRIPPGQLSDMARLVDIDPALVDAFYSKKGLVGDDGKLSMGTADMERFMLGIKDLGAILAMPPSTTRYEWDMARRRYSELLGNVSDEIMNSVDTYYTINKGDLAKGREYMASHPEVGQYLAFREKTIMEDATLFRFYGGYNFVEQYYKGLMSTEAVEKWPEIERLLGAYDDVKAAGGDTKGFLGLHPEIQEYWDFLSAEREEIKKAMAALSGKITESTPIWRSDMNDLSLKAKQAYETRIKDAGTDKAAVDALALPFIGSGEQNTPDFNLTNFLNTEAEKRWPGITESTNAYKAAAAKSPGLASAYLVEHPEVAEYIKWEKEMRKRYNASLGGKNSGGGAELRVMTWADWAGVFSTPTRRLLEDYFRTGTMPDNLRASITRTLNAAGITDVDSWLQQMAASITAPA